MFVKVTPPPLPFSIAESIFVSKPLDHHPDRTRLRSIALETNQEQCIPTVQHQPSTFNTDKRLFVLSTTLSNLKPKP